MSNIEEESDNTCLQSCKTTSLSTASSPQKKHTVVASRLLGQKRSSASVGDDSGVANHHERSQNDHWTFTSPCNQKIIISADIASRLRVQCIDLQEGIDGFLRCYLLEQYIRSNCSQVGDVQLFTVGSDFFILCKELCDVTHELFVDGLNRSGVLPFFCSGHPSDVFLGSSGRWEEVEDSVAEAAGMPSFQNSCVRNVIDTFEQGITTEKPYCRVLLLPFEKNGALDKKEDTHEFAGEILVRIPPHKIAFRHQRDFFIREDDVCVPWRPRARMALVIWINEAYRVEHPPPADVEECLVLWSLHSLGDDRFVDFDAVFRAFPERNRSAETRAEVFEELQT